MLRFMDQLQKGYELRFDRHTWTTTRWCTIETMVKGVQGTSTSEGLSRVVVDDVKWQCGILRCYAATKVISVCARLDEKVKTDLDESNERSQSCGGSRFTVGVVRIVEKIRTARWP